MKKSNFRSNCFHIVSIVGFFGFVFALLLHNWFSKESLSESLLTVYGVLFSAVAICTGIYYASRAINKKMGYDN